MTCLHYRANYCCHDQYSFFTISNWVFSVSLIYTTILITVFPSLTEKNVFHCIAYYTPINGLHGKRYARRTMIKFNLIYSGFNLFIALRSTSQ